jgi:Skp family chaperone for outer membrane proteins
VDDLKRRLTMSLRGKSPRGPGRSGALAVFGLCLALLPFAPVWGWAQPEPEKPKRDVLFRFAPQGEAGAADLKKLEAEMARKAAELADLRAKVNHLKAQARLKALQDERKRQADSAIRSREIRAEAGKGGAVIRIEISGLNLDAGEWKKLAEALEKTLPGKEKRVILLGGPVAVRLAPVAPVTIPGVQVGRVVRPVPVAPEVNLHLGGAPAADKRLENLEKTLQAVMRELEALRKDLRGGRGAGRDPRR